MKCEIIIDAYRCKSCGACWEICPDLFQQNDFSEKAEALKSPAECSDELEQAVTICPTSCIEIKCGD